MKKTEKISYEVDPHNRLVISGRSSGAMGPARFRTVADGMFRIENGNILTYHVNRSQDRSVPQKIRFSGNWSIDRGRNLVLTLDKWNEGCYGNKLTIKAGVIFSGDGSVSFSVATRDSGGKKRIYVLTLDGVWRAGKDNEIIFKAEKERGICDELYFECGWKIKDNQIICSYARRDPATKGKTAHIFVLKGYWQISEKNRLVYVLSKRIGSELDFRVSFAEPMPGGIRYEMGAGVKPAKKAFEIFGSWNVNKRLGLVFEIPYEGGKVRNIVFGAVIKLCQGTDVELRLKNDSGRYLEISGKLSRKIFDGQGEAFCETLLSGAEISAAAGIGFRW